MKFSDELESVLEFMRFHRMKLQTNPWNPNIWEIYVADPGGHYLEDRIKVLGAGTTISQALKKALTAKGVQP